MKKCKDCKETKPYNGFYKDKSIPDGHWNRCKLCEKLRVATPELFIKTIYRSQVLSSKRRQHPLPNYTPEELYKWLIKQPNYKELFTTYRRTLKRLDAPSIDRLDDYEPYTLDNIRLISWKENKNRYHSDVKKGVNTKVSKAINQYDMEGNFIATYHSLAEAYRVTGVSRVSIRKCAIGQQSRGGDFLWEYRK